jgi:poly(A) polymerase
MDEKLNQIMTQARIPRLASLLGPGEECFLVGGALRDWRLGKVPADFDFATPFDPTALATGFAKVIGGHWFMLDAERRQSRIVARVGEGATVTYDFAPFRAADLVGDLLLRDFTVNALVLPLHPVENVGLLDPLDGLGDLERKVLRACSSVVFADDPLRILKGVRHAVALGFVIDGETFQYMREAAGLLPRIAAERIRGEVAGIFAAADPEPGLFLLRDLRLAEELFGVAVDDESSLGKLRRTAAVFACLETGGEGVWLDGEVEGGVSRRTLLTMAAFLHGYPPMQVARFLEKLRFGKKTTAILRSQTALDRARAGETAGISPSPRAHALWAAGLGPGTAEHLAFLPVLMEEPAGTAVARITPILNDFRTITQNGRIPDLVDGEWIKKEFGLNGPVVGKMLGELRKEEMADRVGNSDEAKKFLRKSAETGTRNKG